ncbi:phage tail protein [Paraburkholderia antibiotica]|uniref:Phage tail protein n=1 Tax=Paraburkholderia antibiotica TaxID=2728839 RepID=A0A7X9ZYJ8_9BURK|nr:phage tail protein [Paraburkholderia antibiotica]NML31780.1 phage tail protein [Paraburkholderia antibiotica]
METTGFPIGITDSGRVAMVSPDGTGTNKRRVVQIGIGAEPFEFTTGIKSLPGEFKRIETFGGMNVAPGQIHVSMLDSGNDQYTMYAFGLYLDTGELLAAYVQPTPILEKASAANMLLSADILFTDIDVSSLTFGNMTFVNPPASTTVAGVVRLATQDEVSAGTDDQAVVTPKTAAGRYASRAGDIFSGPVVVNDTLTVNRSEEGRILVGQSDGYFFANAYQAGWCSLTLGSWAYSYAARNLYVNDNAVWHAGNLSPLDVKTGGTMDADLMFASDARLLLGEGGALNPSLAFISDGARSTGLYHVNDGMFAVTCNGTTTVRFTPTGTAFDVPLTGPTPPAGDASALLATTEWVTSTIAAASIGQIVIEARTSARAGCLKLNGALLVRADYPALWAYAQASGALVDESQWSAGSWGCFSRGDGETTFRIPELRGESIRCWDDGRGIDASRSIGSWQDSQNRSHAHGASAAAVGDHTHSAWTDTQGFHDHPVSDYGHIHATRIDARGASSGGNKGYFGPSGGNVNETDVWNSDISQSNIVVDGNGNHAHNVGMNGAGGHAHAITVNADGGAETRVRSVALLAMIRAY